MRYVPLVWSALWRKPVRTLLTVAAVSIGFYLFGILKGFDLGFSEFVASLPDARLSIAPRSQASNSGLPVRLSSAVSEIPGVAVATHTAVVTTYYQEPSASIRLLAIEPEPYFAVYDDIVVSREALAALNANRTAIIVGSAQAEEHGWQVGDRVPLIDETTPRRNGTSTWLFDIVGLWHPASGSTMQSLLAFMRYDYYDDSRASRNGLANGLFVRVEPTANPADVAHAIDTMLINSATPTRTLSIREIVETQLRRVGDIRFFVNTIVASALLTILFVTAGTLTQSFQDRIPELAVLRSVGFNDASILTISAIESATIWLSGACIGIGLAYSSAPGISAAIDLLSLDIPSSAIRYALLIACALAALCLVIPAFTLRRISVIAALGRH